MMSDILNRLAEAVPLSGEELIKLIRSAPMRYKVYNVPKRTPDLFRTIAQPAREVKALQYWVMSNVLKQFTLHPAALAYRDGKNIADNALPHAGSRYLLKLDFKDFFPSIRDVDLRTFMASQAKGIAREDVDLLARILFWRPKGTRQLRLAIGAPSSPLLSNILLFEFDTEVSQFCSNCGVAYTRYADDLSFSAGSSGPLAAVEYMVSKLCERTLSPRLTLNREKTVRVSKKRSRRVTGLVLTNEGKVSLGRDQKRRVRAGVHQYLAGKLDNVQSTRLRGMLAFVKSVEPEYLDRLRAKYGADRIRQIQIFK